MGFLKIDWYLVYFVTVLLMMSVLLLLLYELILKCFRETQIHAQ